jgi:predicted MFS family arabinose efflux permease
LWAGYFASLGLGFILIEIVFIQRFSLFLGYPVYSLSVVLFTMLLSSAVGSLIAGRFGSRRSLPAILLALAAVLVVYALALPPVLEAARGAGIASRILLAVAVIAPLGFVMGMPFPSGIRRAGQESKELVSWAWAVNGGASVFGSTVCVLISMARGFTASFVAGTVVYLLALCLSILLGEARPPSRRQVAP